MFYDNFMKLCEEKNVTVQEVANELGFSRTNIFRWKKARLTGIEVVLRKSFIQKLANYFNCTEEDLFKNDYFYKNNKLPAKAERLLKQIEERNNAKNKQNN